MKCILYALENKMHIAIFFTKIIFINVNQHIKYKKHNYKG